MPVQGHVLAAYFHKNVITEFFSTLQLCENGNLLAYKQVALQVSVRYYLRIKALQTVRLLADV